MAEVLIGTTKVLSMVTNTASNATIDLLIKTMSFTSSNIYYLGKSIFSTSKIIGIKELEQVEKELDLLETIKIYESWIVELCEKNKLSTSANIDDNTCLNIDTKQDTKQDNNQDNQDNKLTTSIYISSPTFKLSIESIHNILEDLHQLLKQIDTKIQYHQTIWFGSWRSIDLSNELYELKFKKKILDSRFDILQKIKL